MKAVLYILPHQLFEKKYLTKLVFEKIIIWEHPDFFTKFNFNKKKLILHRASMRKYFHQLQDDFKNVEYVEFFKKHTVQSHAMLFDPVNDMPVFKNCVIIESPNFLLPKQFHQNMYDEKKSKDSIRFTTYFYPRAKEHLEILYNVENTDKLNRKPLKSLLADYKEFPKQSKKNEAYIKEAQAYVQEHFESNYGDGDNFNFPIDTLTAFKWLDIFIKYRFKYFGTYQDAIVEGESMLYHSGLSSSINIGLIQPNDIVVKIQKHKDNVSVNNYEGYIRQLIWREYQRYCYMFLKNDLKTKNRFDLKKPLSKAWYDGTLGVHPVDVTIKKAFATGYLHHIERLMIMGNFMLLSQINMDDGFKWFMEFAIDSYEWLMYQNVYDMVFFSTGGKTTHKAYISSSAYVLKMSNFQKGPWVDEWNAKYKQFKQQHF